MVTLYIAGEPVELFEDEGVSITLQTRNYNDINKIYSDYSKPFTIPATAHNNRLLSHWYEQGQTDGLNAHNGIISTLSISGLPDDRLGMIELISANIENGKPTSYEVVFYGLQRNISVEIGEKRLAQVDWSDFNHVANYANIRNSWSGSLLSGDVLYPVFDYGVGYLETSGSNFATQNISQTTGAVILDNLRPSFLLRKMLIKCFEDVGVTVQGAWTTDTRLNNLYCLPMEKAGKYKDHVTGDLWTAKTTQSQVLTGVNLSPYTKITNFTQVTFNPLSSVNLGTQEFTAPAAGNYTFQFATNITTNTSDTVQFVLIKNGLAHVFGSAVAITSGLILNPITQQFTATLAVSDVVWVGIKTTTVSSVTLSAQAVFSCIQAPSENFINIDAKELMPDIKVKDFIKSCVDSFNLVFTPINDDTISIDFMQGYYSEDDKADITPYVNTDNYQFEKIDIFKEINFAHDQKQDFANEIYRAQTTRDYGSVRYFPQSDFGSDTLNVKTAFQVPTPDLIQTYNNGGLPSGNTNKDILKAVDKDLKQIQIPLALFYYCGTKTVDTWYLFNNHLAGSRVATAQTSWPVCRTYAAKPSTTSTLSLAFGFEGVIDEVYEDAPARTLLQEFWREYLNNTFDPTTRRLTIAARLPKQLLFDINLKTLITVNGQVYAIEKMEYNSGSDVVNFTLVTWHVSTTPTDTRVSTSGNNINVAGKSPDEPRYGGDDVYLVLLGGVSVLAVPQASPSKDINLQVSDLQNTVDGLVLSTGDKHYTHVQSEASAGWEITHNLDKYPSVQVTTSAGDIVIGDIFHTNTNNCVITFSAAFAGKATFN